MIGVNAVLAFGGKLIDSLVEDKNEANRLKTNLAEKAMSGDLKFLEEQSNVIRAEINGDSWLQRNWRPIVMLVFTGLVVAHWLGWTAPNLTDGEVLSLLDIVKVGLGGYVVGRSAEKVAKVWKGKD